MTLEIKSIKFKDGDLEFTAKKSSDGEIVISTGCDNCLNDKEIKMISKAIEIAKKIFGKKEIKEKVKTYSNARKSSREIIKDQKEMVEFLKKNIEKLSNKELIIELKKRFDIDFTAKRIADFMNYRGIKRKKRGKTRRYSLNYEKIKSVGTKKKEKEERKNSTYTKERVNWLRENYVDISREELHEKFNEEFGLDITLEGIKGALKSYKITKTKTIEYKQKVGKPKTYTKEVIDFIRNCASDGLTMRESLRKCELEFERPFIENSFRNKASINKIRFVDRKTDFDLDNIEDEKIELIKKYKQLPTWEVRDKLIEKFGKGMNGAELKKIIRKLNVIEENKEDIDKEKKPIFTYAIEKIIEENYDIMTDKELMAEIWDQYKKRFTEEEIKKQRIKLGYLKREEIETEGSMGDVL